MRIHEFAKVLSEETGREIQSSDILDILIKKKPDLKAQSSIDEDMMNFLRMKITGKPAIRIATPASPVKPETTDKKAAEKAGKKTEKKTAEKAEKKTAEKSAEKAEKKTAEKTEKKTEEKAEKKAAEKAEKKTAEKKTVEKADKTEKKAAEKTEKTEKKTAEKADKEEKKASDNAEKAEKKPVEKTAEKTENTVEKAAARVEKPQTDKEEVKSHEKTEKKAEEKTDGDRRPQQNGDRRPQQGGDRRPQQNGDRRPQQGDRRPGQNKFSNDRNGKDGGRDGNRFGGRDGGRDGNRFGGKGGLKDGGRKFEKGRDFGGKDDDDERDVRRDSKRPSAKKDRSDNSGDFGDTRRDSKRADRRAEGKRADERKYEAKHGEAVVKKSDQKREQKRHEERPVQKKKEKEEETIKTIILPESLSLSELADKLKQPVNALIKKLFLEGKMYTVNTELSFEEAGEIALEYNCIAEEEEKVDIVEEALKDIEDPEDSLVTRPPVVCVMGHVDHGKTSLLDAIRHSSVTEGEAGGITQHIGAYTVKVNDKVITFLDTPGHEAFTAMRLRGAKSTDIAILVVAADDGVMPQTVEAINHAKAAGIQIIVAVNKIDKPSANIERVKQELTEHGLIAEDWGGDTIFCPVSAHTHEGLDNLLDMILLTSEMLELKANPNRKARGVVIEARLDKGRGPVATLLVQKGTLKVGDFIAIGEAHGRVRAMNNDKGKPVKEVTPSMPVEIIGLSSVPNSGDTFISTQTEKEARQISEAFVTKGKENLIAESRKQMSLDDIFSKMQEGTLKELNIIIKADVQGSVEALKQSLLKLSNDEVIIKCIHSGVGAINESDVVLASASSAIIIGFNVRPDPQAKAMSDQEKVDVRLYRVIYNAIDDIESAMKGMLDPVFEEKIIGHAEVRNTFKASGVGTIAGCFVLDGVIERNCMVRISRDGDQIFDGKLSSLKRFKDDAKEVKNGYECGMVFEGWNDLSEGDRIEAYKMVEVERK